MSGNNNWPPMTVLEHACEGLTAFQTASTYRCIPCFDADGYVYGCDDGNVVGLVFCPFCAQPFVCPLCGLVWNDCRCSEEQYE